MSLMKPVEWLRIFLFDRLGLMERITLHSFIVSTFCSTSFCCKNNKNYNYQYRFRGTSPELIFITCKKHVRSCPTAQHVLPVNMYYLILTIG